MSRVFVSKDTGAAIYVFVGPNRLSMPTMIPLGNNWWWRFETVRQQR
jgi:hypothetical protein